MKTKDAGELLLKAADIITANEPLIRSRLGNG
jgi:hypothetical protein